jgi:DNA-binding HxlR family transcriptional regulator
MGMKKHNGKADTSRRFAYDGLDRVIHERARLSVLTSLVKHARGLRFTDLKRFCALTDGNLNRHLQVLEQAKLVTIVKTVEEGRPQTLCRMTTVGRKRYVDYLEVLEQVVLDAAAGLKDTSEIRLRGVTKA